MEKRDTKSFDKKNKTAEGSDWLCKYQMTGTADYIGTVGIFPHYLQSRGHTTFGLDDQVGIKFAVVGPLI